MSHGKCVKWHSLKPQKMRKQKIDRLFAELERDYGVRHDDPFEKNITYRQSDGRFCIIDFELAEDTGEPEKAPEAKQ